MGHRHFFSSQTFETDNDQSWNHLHAEQPHMHLGAGPPENSSIVYPVDNVSIDGVHFASNWNPLRSNGCSSAGHHFGVPHYQPDGSGPSHNPFLHPSTAGSFCMVQENYALHPSSSSYGGQAFHGVEGGFIDLTMGNGRGLYKRKSPGVPTVCERGSTSRHYNAGSSSGLSMSTETWQEKPHPDSHHVPWDCNTIGPSSRGDGLSIGTEGSLRNVRSRAAIDLEANLPGIHLSVNPPRHSYISSGPSDHSSSVDLSGQGSSTTMHEHNHIHMSPAHARIRVSDTSGFTPEMNHFIVGSNAASASAETEVYHNDFMSSENPNPQNLQGPSTQSVRGARSSYTQRDTSAFGASSRNPRVGHAVTLDEGLHLVRENYSSRRPRPFSSMGWRNSDRSRRTRIFNERYRTLSDEAGFRDRLTSEGLVIMDRSAFYGSRNYFDQHRDMRLDVDNMSYEELLALGERIGSVNTGLSEDLMSKCLTESIYCLSDDFQEERRCVICLEEYRNMDDIGTMKTCGHDFHVGCIRKWLSMKNMCPICKASDLADRMEEE